MSGFREDSGVLPIGVVDGFKIYHYTQWYEHPQTGTLTEMIPANKVIMGVAGGSTRNTVHYGAIQDLEYAPGSMIEQKIFPKTWLEKDPSVRWLLMQASPLVSLQEPDTTIAARVVA